jgi:hypothetical protein
MNLPEGDAKTNYAITFVRSKPHSRFFSTRETSVWSLDDRARHGRFQRTLVLLLEQSWFEFDRLSLFLLSVSNVPPKRSSLSRTQPRDFSLHRVVLVSYGILPWTCLVFETSIWSPAIPTGLACLSARISTIYEWHKNRVASYKFASLVLWNGFSPLHQSYWSLKNLRMSQSSCLFIWNWLVLLCRRVGVSDLASCMVSCSRWLSRSKFDSLLRCAGLRLSLACDTFDARTVGLSFPRINRIN